MSAIYILHLSDLHVDSMNQHDAKRMAGKLCDKIKEFRTSHEHAPLTMMIVTGDLVNKGAGHYALARQILTDICRAGDIPAKQAFSVPGNHDVDRACCGADYESVANQLVADPSRFGALTGTEEQVLSRPFEQYHQFERSFCPSHVSANNIPGFFDAELQISGIPFHICGVNSALVAAAPSAASGSFCMGLPLLTDMLNRSGDRLSLVLSHYPLSWIHPKESKQAEQQLQLANAILFTGHTHEDSTTGRGIASAHLLHLGAGAVFGEHWGGKNHCRILELHPASENVYVHQWAWYPDYNWRAFEPLEAHSSGWGRHRAKWTAGLHPSARLIAEHCRKAGLVDIRNQRDIPERTAHIRSIIDKLEPCTELIVVGRSLKDWASQAPSLAQVVNEKAIHLKLALLDENSLPDKDHVPDDIRNRSWIERPVSQDWAMNDVRESMRRFRTITVANGSGGSFALYGLPFYSSHSFVAYTHGPRRYCAEEAGMALGEQGRPFVEVYCDALNKDWEQTAPKTYAGALEKMYRLMLHTDRLLLRDSGDGKELQELANANRARLLVSKIERLGLVDLDIGLSSLDWEPFKSRKRGVKQMLEDCADGSEFITVGRSLKLWYTDRHLDDLAEAIRTKGLRCTFVIADPEFRIGNIDIVKRFKTFIKDKRNNKWRQQYSGFLKSCGNDVRLLSLTKDDYAMEDIAENWEGAFNRLLAAFGRDASISGAGFLRVFGIPAYIPETYAEYEHKKYGKYCTLEPGLGVVPAKRPVFVFQQNRDLLDGTPLSGENGFERLSEIFRGIFKDPGWPMLRLLYSTWAGDRKDLEQVPPSRA